MSLAGLFGDCHNLGRVWRMRYVLRHYDVGIALNVISYLRSYRKKKQRLLCNLPLIPVAEGFNHDGVYTYAYLGGCPLKAHAIVSVNVLRIGCRSGRNKSTPFSVPETSISCAVVPARV